MKRFLLIVSTIFLAACSAEQSQESSTVTNATPDFLTFIPDEGIRLDDASNAGIKMSEDGVLSLVYQDNQSGFDRVTTTTEESDWLEFERGEKLTNRGTFYALTMPDGTYRSYGYNPTKGFESETCLTSRSSTDGVNFTEDEGCRYELQPEDNGRMGVWDVFVNQKGEVVLLYIGDMMGLNNVRKAISTDNGWTFTFAGGNVLGDDDFGGGSNSYVDERSLRMPDGRIILMAMKGGNIYEFISEDDGETFIVNEEPALTPEDYPDLEVSTLNDPQLVLLPDGRYRIYVTAMLGQHEKPNPNGPIDAVLVSATSN